MDETLEQVQQSSLMLSSRHQQQTQIRTSPIMFTMSFLRTTRVSSFLMKSSPVLIWLVRSHSQWCRSLEMRSNWLASTCLTLERVMTKTQLLKFLHLNFLVVGLQAQLSRLHQSTLMSLDTMVKFMMWLSLTLVLGMSMFLWSTSLGVEITHSRSVAPDQRERQSAWVFQLQSTEAFTPSSSSRHLFIWWVTQSTPSFWSHLTLLIIKFTLLFWVRQSWKRTPESPNRHPLVLCSSHRMVECGLRTRHKMSPSNWREQVSRLTLLLRLPWTTNLWDLWG